MIVNLVLDSLAQAAPTAIKNDWTAAANMLGSMFTDNITVNIKVTFTGSGGGAAAGPDNGQFETYSSVYNYLTTTATKGDSTFNALPNATSIGGQSSVAVWNSQLKLMGLLGANDTTTDDASSTFATDISASLMTGVALHEFAHALGRVPFGPQPDIFDFYRFTAPGTYLFSSAIPSSAAYFSLDGGLTGSQIADYGVNSDPSDFLNNSLTAGDPFNEFYSSSTLQYLMPADIEQMDAIGFHPKVNPLAANPYDFAANATGSVLIQSSTGQIDYAKMLNGANQGYVGVATTPGYNVVGQGLISGNSSADVVIQSPSSGQILYANLANGQFSTWGAVVGAPGYTVAGVGDINADHYADIVVEQNGGGQVFYANMNGGVFHNWVAVGNIGSFQVVGVGDVNDDGFADIVIQNSSTGAIDYGNMFGGALAGWVGVAGTPGWTVGGVGDINRDGFADIVIQNSSTGQIAYANMAGGAFKGFVGVGTAPGFKVVAVEDVIGNGFDDIVVQNQSTGQIAYANMTTGTFQGWAGVGTTPGFNVPATEPLPTQGGQSVTPVSAASLGISAASLAPTLLPNYGTVA